MDLPEAVRQYQSILAGFVGFSGVMATLTFNGWLARRQHDRQVAHRTGAVRAALRAELTVALRSFKNNEETISIKCNENDLLVPLYFHNQAYLALLSDIGLLAPYEAGVVVSAYQVAQDYFGKVALIGEEHGPNFTRVPFHKLDDLLYLVRGTREVIERATAALGH